MREVYISIGIVSIGMGAVLGILLARSATKPEPPQMIKTAQLIGFDTRWREAGMTIAMAPPRRVPIEVVVQPEIEVVGATESPKAIPVATKPRDICRGKGRVWVTKRKWRCKR